MGQTLSNFNEVIGERRSTSTSSSSSIDNSVIISTTSSTWRRINPLATWQTNDDRPMRIAMIHRLLELLDIKLGRRIPRQQLADIARLLELALYRRANSRDEYVCHKTLEKRLEYLALIGYPPSQDKEETTAAKASSSSFEKKRKLARIRQEKQPLSFIETRSTSTTISGKSNSSFISSIKRHCTRRSRVSSLLGSDADAAILTTPYDSLSLCDVQKAASSTTTTNSITNTTSSRINGFILNDNPDLINHVLSFLPGEKTCQLSVLNSFCRDTLPAFVKRLSIRPRTLELIYEKDPRGGVLTRCSNLTHLVISNHSDVMKQYGNLLKDKSRVFYDAKGSHQCYCCNNNNAEAVIHQLATSISSKCFLKLETLVIESVFFNSISTNATSVLASAIYTGSLPILKTLALPGNGIGDMGASYIGRAIAGCSSLEILDLRKNYIGEKGMESIASGLTEKQNIEILALGGNILTGRCMDFLIGAVPTLRKLRVLGLDKNFNDDVNTATLVSTVVEHCPHLESILLNNNEAYDYTCRVLKTKLANRSSRLSLVDLGRVSIDGAAALLLLLQQQQQQHVVNANKDRPVTVNYYYDQEGTNNHTT